VIANEAKLFYYYKDIQKILLHSNSNTSNNTASKSTLPYIRKSKIPNITQAVKCTDSTDNLFCRW
jgi:hypothetical protein